MVNPCSLPFYSCSPFSLSLSLSLSFFLSPFLSLSLSLHVSFYQFLEHPPFCFFKFLSFSRLVFLSCTVLKVALIMNLHDSFWQISKKKKKERRLSHSSWTCVLVLLRRWRRPTPRVHISTTSLITRSCWQCHVLPAAICQRPRLEVAREFFFHF